jgi:ABC-type iron transport system FetAB ATPase subunit
MIILSLIVLLNFSYAVETKDEIQPQTFSAEEISAFDKKFKEIDVYMNFFREKMVEHDDIIKSYTDAERLFRDLKTSPDISDINLAREHLNTKIDNLEGKAKQKVSYIRRMDFMYQTMVILGLGIIIFMVVYSIYMYLRRK